MHAWAHNCHATSLFLHEHRSCLLVSQIKWVHTFWQKFCSRYPFGFMYYIGPVAVFRWIFGYTPFGQACFSTLFSFAAASLITAGGFFGMQVGYSFHFRKQTSTCDFLLCWTRPCEAAYYAGCVFLVMTPENEIMSFASLEVSRAKINRKLETKSQNPYFWANIKRDSKSMKSLLPRYKKRQIKWENETNWDVQH